MQAMADQRMAEAGIATISDPEIERLLALDDNMECADCTEQSCTWASWNLGVFICIKCSGVHRQLGTHITKVKSVDLDEWTPEELECMSTVGNRNAAAYWEYSVPFGLEKPQASDPMAMRDHWIRAKYERMEFTKGGARANESPDVRQYERSGYLFKESGGNSKWQERWFVLKDFELFYYKTREDKVPAGHFPILQSTVIGVAENFGGPQDRMIESEVFEITTGVRTYYIKVKSKPPGPEQILWLQSLRGVRAFAKTEDARKTHTISMNGHLYKQGNGVKSGKFSKRWCVLRGESLYYYKNKASKHPLGLLNLRPSCVSESQAKPFCLNFRVDGKDGQPRDYVMYAESEAAYQAWYGALAEWV